MASHIFSDREVEMRANLFGMKFFHIICIINISICNVFAAKLEGGGGSKQTISSKNIAIQACGNSSKDELQYLNTGYANPLLKCVEAYERYHKDMISGSLPSGFVFSQPGWSEPNMPKVEYTLYLQKIGKQACSSKSIELLEYKDLMLRKNIELPSGAVFESKYTSVLFKCV